MDKIESFVNDVIASAQGKKGYVGKDDRYRREEAYSINQMSKWKEIVKGNTAGYAMHCGVPVESSTCTFGNFVQENETSKKAYSVCMEWISSPEHGNLSIYSSSVGNGKTHLAVASMLNYAVKWSVSSEYKPKVMFYNFAKLVKEMKEFYSNNDSDNDLTDDWAVKYLADLDLLVLDDIGSEKTTPFVEAFVYDILESRRNLAKPTIVTTNITNGEIEKRYGKRVASRFHDGNSITFDGSDNRRNKKYSREIPAEALEARSLMDLVRSYRFNQTSDLKASVFRDSINRVRKANSEF